MISPHTVLNHEDKLTDVLIRIERIRHRVVTYSIAYEEIAEELWTAVHWETMPR